MSEVIVSYKGIPISNLTTTSQARLETAGTYLEDNISVNYTAPDLEITSLCGDNAFKGCAGLTTIRGNTPTALGNNCFQNCTNLTAVSGFDDVLTAGTYVFNGCTALTSISGFNKLTTASDYFCDGCSSLVSVSGFESLENIGVRAFRNCNSLTTLPITPVIKTIGTSAFAYDTSLVKFEVPTNVTSLANKIFYGCTALTDIVIHGTVDNFAPGSANNAMTNGCTNLERVTLPGGSYGSYVLYNNKKITDITIGGPGNPVTSINANAFYVCNGVPCDFVVYTVDAQEISHNSSNYWGNNKSGTTCTFKDSNGVKPDYTIGF